MIACPACHEATDPTSEICMECGEPLEPGTQAPGASPAIVPPSVPRPVAVAPKRKLRVDEPDPVRCPGCGSPGRGERCGGCGTLLRRG